MSFITATAGPLEYLRSDTLTARHAFSTRYGGVSTGDLDSLNLGVHRGDRPGNVLENYRRLGRAVGFSVRDLVFTRQIHTDQVRIVTAADRGQGLFFPAPDCDGLITNTPGVALAAFSADCTPILLFDPAAGAVGAVHAGWRGTALGIVRRAVEAMEDAFGVDPKNLRAAIGPCIGKCCFETRGDVPDAMRAALGERAQPAITRSGETYRVDLKLLNALWLREAGVEQIDVCPACTACEPNRFWSHRRVGNRRGSLAAIIVCP